MAYAVERFGGLDILVTAAAFVEFAPIEDMDYERQWRRDSPGRARSGNGGHLRRLPDSLINV
ncbi:MAG TPA: hypothetical protein VIL51_03790 [Thermoleophilia bacterium]|jgi:hypothetical protein